MTDAALLQMIVPASAAQLLGKQPQGSTAVPGAESSEGSAESSVGAVFAELLVVEPGGMAQQIAQPDTTQEFTLPAANPLTVGAALKDGEIPSDIRIEPVHTLIQGQNPDLKDLPPAIAVEAQGKIITRLSEVPDVAPAEVVTAEDGGDLVANALTGTEEGVPVFADGVAQVEQQLPESVASNEPVVVEDEPALVEVTVDQATQAPVAPVELGEREVEPVEQLAPRPTDEPMDFLASEQPQILTDEVGQEGAAPTPNGAEGEIDPAAAPIVVASAPASETNQPRVDSPAAQAQTQQAAASQNAPAAGNPDALPDDQADASILKTAEAPVKSTQAEDRRATGDLASDRLNTDGPKSGQSSEQGSQFSDGRGEDRRGQQSSPLIFTAGKNATVDARPTVTADRSQNSGFANALLGGGQTAELDSSYDQMPARLRIAVANGVKQLTVHLQPANLGSMEVRLDGTEDGGLRATFLVQRPETLDLLQRDARVLERALSDAGVSVDRDSLNFSLSDQGNRNGGLASDSEQSGSGIRDGQADDASGEDDLIEQDIPIDTAAIIEAGRIDVHI